MPAFASRLLISSFQSGMFDPGDAADRFDELAPAIPLCGEHLLSFRSQTGVAPASLSCLLDPSPLNPSALFESIQQGIERCDIELERPTGSSLDEGPDVVPMPWLVLEEREYEQIRAPLLQFPIHDPRPDMWHSHILLSRISRVNTGILVRSIRFCVSPRVA